MTDPNATTEATFSTGQMVRHRASGERAVVTVAYETCQYPAHQSAVGCLFPRSDCEYVPTGTYRVSYGFGWSEEVDECVLEADADQPESRGST